MFMPQPSSVMNAKKKHPSSSSSSKTRKIEKTHHQPPPPVNSSLKLIIKFKNSKPYAILPLNKCNQSRKRKQPQKEEINMGLSLYDQSCFNIKNKKSKILDPPPAAYMGSKQSPEEIRVAKKLGSFGLYSHQQEEEKVMGVSTKLKLHDDPRCIGVI